MPPTPHRPAATGASTFTPFVGRSMAAPLCCLPSHYLWPQGQPLGKEALRRRGVWGTCCGGECGLAHWALVQACQHARCAGPPFKLHWRCMGAHLILTCPHHNTPLRVHTAQTNPLSGCRKTTEHNPACIPQLKLPISHALLYQQPIICEHVVHSGATLNTCRAPQYHLPQPSDPTQNHPKFACLQNSAITQSLMLEQIYERQYERQAAGASAGLAWVSRRGHGKPYYACGNLLVACCKAEQLNN